MFNQVVVFTNSKDIFLLCTCTYVCYDFERAKKARRIERENQERSKSDICNLIAKSVAYAGIETVRYPIECTEATKRSKDATLRWIPEKQHSVKLIDLTKMSMF